MAAEKAQNPAKGVISGLSTSFNSSRIVVMHFAAWKRSAALSDHQLSGLVAFRSGGSIGPWGLDVEDGKNGMYSRLRNSILCWLVIVMGVVRT